MGFDSRGVVAVRWREDADIGCDVIQLVQEAIIQLPRVSEDKALLALRLFTHRQFRSQPANDEQIPEMSSGGS